MINTKFRFFDTLTNDFYRPTYEKYNKGRIEELLVTQQGEIIMRSFDNGKHDFVHEHAMDPRDRFIKDGYTGVKDSQNKRYYFNDIVCFTTDKGVKSYGVLVWDGDKLAIGSGPINDYHAIDPITEKQLRESECAGNIYHNYGMIMGGEYKLTIKEGERIPTIFKPFVS